MCACKGLHYQSTSCQQCLHMLGLDRLYFAAFLQFRGKEVPRSIPRVQDIHAAAQLILDLTQLRQALLHLLVQLCVSRMKTEHLLGQCSWACACTCACASHFTSFRGQQYSDMVGQLRADRKIVPL